MSDPKREPVIFEFMTAAEAAAFIRMSVRTLEDKRLDGTGPRYFKLGPGKRAKVIYRRENLIAWVSQFSFGSTSEYPE